MHFLPYLIKASKGRGSDEPADVVILTHGTPPVELEYAAWTENPHFRGVTIHSLSGFVAQLFAVGASGQVASTSVGMRSLKDEQLYARIPGRVVRPGQQSLPILDVFQHMVATCKILEAYIHQWSHYERSKNRERFLTLSDQERLMWLRQVAILSEEFAGHLRTAPALTSIIRYARAMQESGDISIKPEQYHEFVEAIRLSMFLVRDPITDRIEFSHDVLREYLVGRSITDEIQRLQGNMQTRMAIGCIPLVQSESIQHFCYWTLAQAFPHNLVNELGFALRAVCGTSGSGWGLHYHSRNNLLLLMFRAAIECSKECFVDLAYCDLSMTEWPSQLILQAQNLTLRLNGANLEMAVGIDSLTLPQDAFRPELRSDRHRRHQSGEMLSKPRTVTVDDDVLRDYCQNSGLLTPEFTARSSHNRDLCDLGVFVPIPGGGYPVRTQFPASSATVVGPMLSKPSSEEPEYVALPSFLIQQLPVTNRQFAYFVSKEGNESFDRINGRIRLGNDYYLSQWELWNWPNFVQTLRDTGLPPTQLTENDLLWLESPVVYVDFEACKAFASYFGMRLPFEVEIEVCSRSMQRQPELLNLVPWDDAALSDSFVTHLTSGYIGETGTAPSPSLYLVCDQKVQQRRDALLRWSRERFGGKIQIPLDIIGGVWEWTNDSWSAIWPSGGAAWNSGNRDLESKQIRAKPCVTPFPAVEPFGECRFKSLDSLVDSWDRNVSPDHLTLRGSSYRHSLPAATIENRAPMFVRNHNPDGGFRCILEIKGDSGT
jgi:formylglycine-generating enzyme required for sulfatase activity